jgi:type IV pilus assembly protein PilA
MDTLRRSRPDEGFTLIELMVVVLIIAILLAIAIPTFFGAREKAADRAAQSNLRNANTNAFAYYVGEQQQFTENTTLLAEMDPSLKWTNDFAALATDSEVFVKVPPAGTNRPNDTLYVAAKSRTGRCYWIRNIGDENHPRFATTICSSLDAAAPEVGLTFVDSW